MAAALNPLPSLIRASAHDVGNLSMRKAGREVWCRKDYNEACRTQERLIRACYGRASDHNNPNIVYIRFSIAEAMQRQGLFNLASDVRKIHAQIDAILEPEIA